jgi:hypothetical protein
LGYSGHWTIEDDTLSEEYANHLWPRAIGYAGEAVQYFFRGAIMGRIESQGVRIFNRGFEEMNGTFALYCDDTEGMRTPVPVGSGQARLAPDFLQSYLVPVTELAGFTGCVVVFTGIMGEEQDAVVGAELPLGNIGSTVESFTCQSPAACNGDNPHPTCTAITASGTFTAPKSIVWTFFMIAESPPQQPANLVGDAQVQCGDWTAGSLHPNSGIATCTRTTTEQPETTHWTARGAIDMASSGTQTYSNRSAKSKYTLWG